MKLVIRFFSRRAALIVSTLLTVAVFDFMYCGSAVRNQSWPLMQGLPWLLFFGLLHALILGKGLQRPQSSQSQFLSCSAAAVSLSFIIEPTRLAMILIWPLLLLLALSMRSSSDTSVGTLLLNFLFSTFLFWWHALHDSRLLRRYRAKHGGQSPSARAIMTRWALPVLGSVVFGLLFSASNPVFSKVVESALDSLDTLLFDRLDRAVVWMLVGLFTWALLRPYAAFRLKRPAVAPLSTASGDASNVHRSLMLFNALFAINNYFDLEFLWMNVALPKGMTYAQYAHQGAYSLMCTTMLAAIFILWAFGKGKPASRDALARRLVYLWTAQNVFLLASTVLRLVRYIEEYALSELRLYTILWCFIVLIGFGLLLARLILDRSNEWLVSRNAAVALLSLTLCCLINFNGLIAWYNVMRPFIAKDDSKVVDVQYLLSLGVEALPAARWYEAKTGQKLIYREPCTTISPASCERQPVISYSVNYLETRVLHQSSSWRFRTLRRTVVGAGGISSPEGLSDWIWVLLF